MADEEDYLEMSGLALFGKYLTTNELRQPRNLVFERFLAPALASIAILSLAVAYVTMAHNHASWWLWYEVVHEDGIRTFKDTVYFFEHALRELPLDLMLGITIGASVACSFPDSQVERRHDIAALATIAVTLAFIVVGALICIGPSGIVVELSQSHTRNGAPLAWGAHWNYHLVSRMALILSAGSLVVLISGNAQWHEKSFLSTHRPLLVSLGFFLLLSLLFRPTIAPFTDARFLGHQAREFITHILTTVPLALSCTLPFKSQRAPFRVRPRSDMIVLIAFSLSLALWLGIGALVTDAQSQAQSNSLVPILAGHMFEHTFGFVLVPASALVARSTVLKLSTHQS